MNEVLVFLERNCPNAIVSIIDHIMVSPKLRDQMKNVTKQDMDQITTTILNLIAKKTPILPVEAKDSLIRLMSHLVFGKYEMSTDVMNKLLRTLLTLAA